jgi:AcrR family transcriptional regulator
MASSPIPERHDMGNERSNGPRTPAVPAACGPLTSRGCPDRERRRQLIAVAERVFLEKGYHLATMDDIARLAGVSKKTIYVEFHGKAALFDALLAERLAPLAAPIPEDGRPMAAVLSDYLLSVARFALSARQIALTRLMVAESPHSPEVAQALRAQAVCNGDSALDAWLATQAARGTLRLSDARQAGAMLFGMSIGELLLAQLVKADPPPAESEVARRIELAVAMFLAAYAQPVAAPLRPGTRGSVHTHLTAPPP